MNTEEIKEFAKAIRRIALQMAHNTNTSHTGGTLSQADVLAVLYSGVLNAAPDRLDDPCRDRFIESKGHCCASFYAALALKGFMDLDHLMENYCKNGTEYYEHVSHKLPGVELSTGSLGHGLPVACGMALGSKRSKNPYNVYIIVGDGEMNEGSNWEAIMFAAHNQLDNLCLIIDKNKMQALGDTKDVLCLDPLPEKLKAFGWNVINIDGHNYDEIIAAFENFKKCESQPTVIVSNTIKGKGVSFMEHNLKFHYSAPNAEELAKAMEELQ